MVWLNVCEDCNHHLQQVVGSSVGPVHALPVRVALEILVALMTDEINDRVLARGFALPEVPFIAFVQPTLLLLDGALAVLTDLAYQESMGNTTQGAGAVAE